MIHSETPTPVTCYVPDLQVETNLKRTLEAQRQHSSPLSTLCTTYVQNQNARMRRISLRSIQRRPPGHEHCGLSQSTLASILEPRSGYDPLPRIKDILADLNRSTSRVHLPLTTVPAKTEFKRVVSQMLSAAMATEPTGPSTRSYLTPAGLRKIEPYWYPYTTMAKGRWLGREMLEIVSTEFRDRSIDYYVSPKFCLCPEHHSEQYLPPRPEICPRIRSNHNQRGCCEARYHSPER